MNGAPVEIENGDFKGRILLVHRPKSSFDNSDGEDYPYKSHFHGRKRLWEWRFQGQFRTRPGMLYCGIELEDYVSVNFATRTLMRGLLPLVQAALQCKLVHHEVGREDDRDLRPAVIAPIWAADNTLVHLNPAEAPDITSVTVPSGMNRTAARKFWEEVWDGGGPTWEPGGWGPTFTWCVWGPSPLLDLRRWVFRKVPMTWGRDLSMEPFCGQQPVHGVIYELRSASMAAEHRQDDKKYHIDVRLVPGYLWPSLSLGRSSGPASPRGLGPGLEALIDQGLPSMREHRDDDAESFCSAVSQTSDPEIEVQPLTVAEKAHPATSSYSPTLRPPSGVALQRHCEPSSEQEPLRSSLFAADEPSGTSSQLPMSLVQPSRSSGGVFACCRRRRRTPLAEGFELV